MIEDVDVDVGGRDLRLDRGDCCIALCFRTAAHVYNCIFEGKEADGLKANSSVTSCHKVDFPAEVRQGDWIEF